MEYIPRALLLESSKFTDALHFKMNGKHSFILHIYSEWEKMRIEKLFGLIKWAKNWIFDWMRLMIVCDACSFIIHTNFSLCRECQKKLNSAQPSKVVDSRNLLRAVWRSLKLPKKKCWTIIYNILSHVDIILLNTKDSLFVRLFAKFKF